MIPQEHRVKMSTNTYLFALWSALLLPANASALEGKPSQQDSPGQTRSEQGRIHLAQNQYDAKAFFIPHTTGQVGTPFHLTIIVLKQNEHLQWRTLVFKNLPNVYIVSPGTRIDDEHYVNYSDFDKVTIMVPRSAQPEAMLSAVFLHKDRHIKELHELKIAVAGTGVNVSETDGSETETPAPAAATSPTVNPVSSMASAVPLTESRPASGPSRIDPVLESTYLQRADKLLKLGQIAPARLLFEHLANRGSARGALLLGETYDQNYLKSLNVVGGVSAGKNKALYWYRKAEELGAAEASAHIQRLN
ncbi:MAG: hypothetical protein ACLPWS_21100 [Rhodomicrobium sp.]